MIHTDAAALVSGHIDSNNSEPSSDCYSAYPIQSTPSVGYYEEVAAGNAPNVHNTSIENEANVSFRNIETSTPKKTSDSSVKVESHQKKTESPRGLTNLPLRSRSLRDIFNVHPNNDPLPKAGGQRNKSRSASGFINPPLRPNRSYGDTVTSKVNSNFEVII